MVQGVKKKEWIILSDRESIEKEATTFFKHLFQGYHTYNGELGEVPFQPDFTDLPYFLQGLGCLNKSEAELLTRYISVAEVEAAIK